MSKKPTRTIELNAATVNVLEARAAERRVSVEELIVELLGDDSEWPADVEEMQRSGSGPWAAHVLAEDEARFEEFDRTRVGVPLEEIRDWLRSWGKPGEVPPPKPRKL